MSTIDLFDACDHEQVAFCQDPRSGYRAVIAIHSTVLGPAVGGTRVWRYGSLEEAAVDALRLSRGMTYKNAMADVPLGGGKAVVLDDGEITDRERLFRAHGRFVDRFGGRFVTAEDVGTSPADMDLVRLETEHVAGLSGGVGDPSPWTARGVFRAIQAAAAHRWGSPELDGRTVAIQGCGNVGANLARELAAAGALLVVADVDEERARRVAAETGAETAPAARIHAVAADVFAPCALGGVVDDATVAALQAEIVAGAANNQLLEDRHGDALAERGILYAPDYVANAGGVLSGTVDLLGWSRDEARRRLEAIYETMLEVFDAARTAGVPPHRAADRLAEERLGAR